MSSNNFALMQKGVSEQHLADATVACFAAGAEYYKPAFKRPDSTAGTVRGMTCCVHGTGER